MSIFPKCIPCPIWFFGIISIRCYLSIDACLNVALLASRCGNKQNSQYGRTVYCGFEPDISHHSDQGLGWDFQNHLVPATQGRAMRDRNEPSVIANRSSAASQLIRRPEEHARTNERLGRCASRSHDKAHCCCLPQRRIASLRPPTDPSALDAGPVLPPQRGHSSPVSGLGATETAFRGVFTLASSDALAAARPASVHSLILRSPVPPPGLAERG